MNKNTLKKENRERFYREDLLEKLYPILLEAPHVKSNELATAWVHTAFANKNLDLIFDYATWWESMYNEGKIWAYREKIFKKILIVESFILGKDHPFLELI